MTTANLNPIEEAKAYAREVIRETWPAAKEVSQSTAGTYEFDAILIDDEACSIASVSIMHDPDADTFALVENTRPVTPPLSEETGQTPTFSFEDPIDWDKLAEDHAIAYLRGDLATSSPKSYTIEEMKAINAGMLASTDKVEEALRADFNAMVPYAQDMMLDLLKKADPGNYGSWFELLAGDAPNNPVGISIDK